LIPVNESRANAKRASDVSGCGHSVKANTFLALDVGRFSKPAGELGESWGNV